MSAGRLIAVVGPSGVGKDTVIAGLCAARPGLHRVRRAITREADAGGEDFEALSLAAFEAAEAAGAYALSWRAHGLAYGIPSGVREVLGAGRMRWRTCRAGCWTRRGRRFRGWRCWR